jgi:prophage antirepressor-like protein
MDLKTLANPFQFAELDIRTATDEHSKIRFCAKDVCAALDIECSSHTLDNMPENRFTATKLIAIKDERNAHSINEAGLYHPIFRPNKPKAKDFANWVCETVLPEIRQTGIFGAISIKDRISVSKQIESISLQIVNNSNTFRRKLLQDRLRRLCNRVNQPIPPPEWIALNHDQVDLFDSPNTN